MAQKIRVTKAEETDWYSIGEVYEISSIQRYVTTGVEVNVFDEKTENTNLWIIKHGDYEEQVDIKLATTTEEQLFTIIISEAQLQGKDGYSLLNECIQTINKKTNAYFPWSELQWSIDIRNTMLDTGRIFICQTFKDSHVHINTTTWMKVCQDFVCELQALLNLETIKAYSQPIKLYTFTKN